MINEAKYGIPKPNISVNPSYHWILYWRRLLSVADNKRNKLFFDNLDYTDFEIKIIYFVSIKLSYQLW